MPLLTFDELMDIARECGADVKQEKSSTAKADEKHAQVALDDFDKVTDWLTHDYCLLSDTIKKKIAREHLIWEFSAIPHPEDLHHRDNHWVNIYEIPESSFRIKMLKYLLIYLLSTSDTDEKRIIAWIKKYDPRENNGFGMFTEMAVTAAIDFLKEKPPVYKFKINTLVSLIENIENYAVRENKAMQLREVVMLNFTMKDRHTIANTLLSIALTALDLLEAQIIKPKELITLRRV